MRSLLAASVPDAKHAPLCVPNTGEGFSVAESMLMFLQHTAPCLLLGMMSMETRGDEIKVESFSTLIIALLSCTT
uniref:Uncharacterized protein n=1 Tax=Anopheles atroparvus TaxID=41427 RepID=A0AAG5DV16_ANOAO